MQANDPAPLAPESARYVFCQDSDSNETGDLGQDLTVEVTDAGGGRYLVLETRRWALDPGGIDQLAETLRWCLRQCKADEGDDA